jgi:hypothetical protein
VLIAGVQVVPLQHPLGHELMSQMHVPATQCCPAAHGAVEPHWQVPPTQLSARSASQATQAIAPVPQVAVDGVLHVEPLQHPVAHPVAQPEQTPPVQVCAPGQTWQSCPPAPHAPAEVVVMQAVPEQQPFGHDTPSQTHMPPEQCCPAAHSTVVPHWQPSAPQLSAVSVLHARHICAAAPQLFSDGVLHTLLVVSQQPESQMVSSQAQPLTVQCWRGPHAGPPAHVQCPSAEQLSERSGSQATQVSPPVPH